MSPSPSNSQSPDADTSHRMYRMYQALQRDANISSDEDFQCQVLDASGTQFIVCHLGKCLLLDEGNGSYSGYFLSKQQLPMALAPNSSSQEEHTLVYLGNSVNSTTYVAVETSRPEQWLGLHESAAFVSLGVGSEGMEEAEAVALLAQALGFCTWHSRTRHCVKCGAKLESTRLGHARLCVDTACAVTSWPRIEPAAIMRITSACGGFTLLGRKKSWPAWRYSCLAGFAEIGETMEQCVLRETLEESGVQLDSDTVRYRLSQPWPFPSSLMVCYSATATATADGELPAVVVQEEEMEDVRWFSLQAVQQAILDTADADVASRAEPLKLPGRASSARFLIQQWVAEKQCVE